MLHVIEILDVKSTHISDYPLHSVLTSMDFTLANEKDDPARFMME
jgi:hypothetical protein